MRLSAVRQQRGQHAYESGVYWVTWADAHARNSQSIEDLAEPFRANAQNFIRALTAAGARVQVRATRRSAKRAYLFHWSWKIAFGKCKATDAGKYPRVDIESNHGADGASKAGARAMVSGFGLAVPPASINAPALASNHIGGDAIDMDIVWTGTVTVRDKHNKPVDIAFKPNVNANALLHLVGASYGVKKLITDAPHWSMTGR